MPDELRSPFLDPDNDSPPRLLVILENLQCGGFHQLMMTEEQHGELLELMDSFSKPAPGDEDERLLPVAHHTHFDLAQFNGIPEYYDRLPDEPDA